MLASLLRAFVLLALLAVCSPALADEPTRPDPVRQALVDKGVPEAVVADARAMLAHYEALAALVEAHADGTCDALAASLVGFADEHAAALHATVTRLEAIDAATETLLQRAFETRLVAAHERMLPPLTACAGHEGVVAAMERISSGKPDKPAPSEPR